jgi:hypothetical protein
LTAAFKLGVPFSGPAKDIEHAMRASGLGDSMPDWFGGPPIALPSSDTGFGAVGMPTASEVNYHLRDSWNLGLVFSHTPIGETSGYRAAGAQFLFVEYETITAGVVASRHYGPFRVAAGPALHRVRVRQVTGGLDGPWVSQSGLGFVALAGARLPKETRVYLDLSLQYGYVGSRSIGPFMALPAGPGTGATLLPVSDAQFSHWIVGFGPGIRF